MMKLYKYYIYQVSIFQKRKLKLKRKILMTDLMTIKISH